VVLSWIHVRYISAFAFLPEVQHKLVDGAERVEVARQLIEFDHKFSRFFSGKPAVAESEGVSMDEFQALWVRMEKWTSGTAVKYGPSLIVADSAPTKTELAQNIIIGSVGQTLASLLILNVSVFSILNPTWLSAMQTHMRSSLLTDSCLTVDGDS
jgi:hypothetical protein